jgi:NADH:ubiquinone oxidoreductase subunit 6 (subunit J)
VLKHRAAFIVVRWLVVLAVAFTGVAGLLGAWIGGALVVLVYAGATIYFELFPGRALVWLNPKEARTDAAEDAARKRKAS